MTAKTTTFTLILLISLIIQTCSHVVSLKYAWTVGSFDPVLAVFLGEVLKFMASGAASVHFAKQQEGSRSLWTVRDVLISSVPAVLYYIQNNLAMYASKRLSAATFHVSYQLKILTTALFSVLILKRQFTQRQWMALVLLTVGVIFVNYQQDKESTTQLDFLEYSFGLYAVIMACVLSGVSGVYWELVLKKDNANAMWVRNVQLAGISILVGGGVMLVQGVDQHSLSTFSSAAWVSVVCGSIGGLLVSAVVKYADNILKCFANSIAVVLTSLLSVMLFGSQLSYTFGFGLMCVVASIWLFNIQQQVSVVATVDNPFKLVKIESASK